MAIWATTLRLEGLSDEENITIESEWCFGPITYCSSPESSDEDFIPLRDHIVTIPGVSASEHEALRIFDGDDLPISAPESSINPRSIRLSPLSDDCHYLGNLHQPRLSSERAASRGLLYQRRMGADNLGFHGITSSVTCPNYTTAILPSDNHGETPLLYTTDNETAHDFVSCDLLTDNENIEYSSQYNNDTDSCDEYEVSDDGHEMNVGLGIDGGDAFHCLFPRERLKINLENDQQIFFSGVEQEQLDQLLAEDVSAGTLTDGQRVDSEEIESFWIEVGYRETLTGDIQELDSTYASDYDSIDSESWNGPSIPNYDNDDIEVYESLDKIAQLDLEDNDPDRYHFSPNNRYDDFDAEINTPFSYFQPLPIGPFALDSPPNDLLSLSNAPHTKNHIHPLPSLSHNPESNTLKVTFTIDENWNCPVFEVFRTDIVPLTGCPVLLSRRVYELQGYAEEKRKLKTERGFRRFMKGWRRVKSSLAAEYVLELGNRDEQQSRVGLVVEYLEAR